MNTPEILPHVQEIRFSDIDAMGHVNNAIYFTYLEQARISFFRQLLGKPWDWNALGIIVARNTMDYQRPVTMKDNLVIKVSPTHLGTKSFTLSYQLTGVSNGEQVEFGTATSILVCFDYGQRKTIEIPDQWRTILASLITSDEA
ncbi:MAG: hypothetical protein RL220_1502 [Bacteroidota bacterium]|jgi:acyl-CoA thioester hydrolase